MSRRMNPSRARRSAGLLVYRVHIERIEVLLAHPGGPLFAKKDAGAWTIPKGEFEGDENPLDPMASLARARKEFEEEIGFAAPDPAKVRYLDLGEITQKGGKIVRAWAAEAPPGLDDVKAISSNGFEMEWPPKSGRMQSFPEVDRAEFFDLATAQFKLRDAQLPFLDRLARGLAADKLG